MSRVPHTLSYSHQITSSAGNSVSTTEDKDRNLGVKGRTSDGASRGAKPSTADVGLVSLSILRGLGMSLFG